MDENQILKKQVESLERLLNLYGKEKEVLEKHVDTLEKLLNIKEALIQQQESKINENGFKPTLFYRSDDCPIGFNSAHEYPLIANTSNPSCLRCGKPRGY